MYMAFTMLQTHQIQANVAANDQKVRKTTRKVAIEATVKTHGKPFFLFLFFLFLLLLLLFFFFFFFFFFSSILIFFSFFFFFFFSFYLQQTTLSSTTHTGGVANKPELQQATDSKNNQKNITESEMSVRLFDRRERGASVVYHLEFLPANHRGYPRRHTLSHPEACHHSAEYQPRISSGLGDENQSRAIGPGVGKIFFKGTTCLFWTGHTSPEVIYLRGITSVKISSNNRIPYQFRS
jgi:hypothetical protein